jgi:hypothetical protein
MRPVAVAAGAGQLPMLRLKLFRVAGGASGFGRRPTVRLMAVDALGVAGRRGACFWLVAAVARLGLSAAMRLMAVGALLVTTVRLVRLASVAGFASCGSAGAGMVR